MSLCIPSMDRIWTVAQSRGQLSDAPNLWRGAAAMWPGQEGGGTILHDVSGNGKHGTLTNMDPATDWVVTEKGRALDFLTAFDEKVLVPTFSLTVNWTLTFLAWGNYSAPPGPHGSMVCGKDDNDNFVYLADGLRLRFENAVGNNVSWTADTAFYHQWRYVALVADTTGITLYLDGKSQLRLLVVPTLELEVFGLGYAIDSYDFKGQLSNISLYNRPLLPSEIEQDAADPLAKYRLRRRVYAVGAVGLPPAGNRRRRIVLFGAGA